MGAGVVILCGTKEKELALYLGEGTSNQAELHAVLKALFALGSEQDLCQFDVTVYTDSAYVVGLLSEGWTANANVDLVKALCTVVAKCGAFQIHHVPGHSGHALNERAHRLAVAGRRNEGNAEVNWSPMERSSNLSISSELTEELETRVDQLRKALSYYADPLTYMPPPGKDNQPPAIVTDRGAVARRVLQALGFRPVEEPFAEAAA